MDDLPEVDSEEMPEWAVRTFNAALKRVAAAAPSAADHRGAAAWPLLVEAAVVNAFLPRELAPSLVGEEDRPGAEKVILDFAEMIYGPEGVKWMLNRQARAEVLEAAYSSGDLLRAVDRTAEQFTDPISRALRKCLDVVPAPGDPVDPPPSLDAIAEQSLDLKSLEAVRAAASLLSGLSFSNVGLRQLEGLDRKIELRRVLAQFERMVEQRTDESGGMVKRYFFGREYELDLLRAYVGVIGAPSFAALFRRALRSAPRLVGDRKVMNVWGVGGVGKTTLISKFMLEHARAAASDKRFPFAYLDFDRPTISARQRYGLLAEMCLHTGTQFEEMSKPLSNLRARALQLALQLQASQESESTSSFELYAREFRQLVDKHLASLESVFEWKRPFLLVFDTFEVVQYTEEDVTSLEEFVQCFSLPEEEKGVWPRMRLIISGRRKVTTFLGEVEELELGALDPEGSADLLVALAANAGKPVERADAKRLVAAVAKATKEKNKGVQPLRLQLLGQVFKDEEQDGPSLISELTEEMKKPLDADGTAAKRLIDGILVRRVLGHIRDPRVKALTDPGLVVRRITPDVIKEVMTRGTARPDAGEATDADTEPQTPWVVDDEEALSIFKAFEREVSLVEPEGDSLRHRTDLRRQMLPLIRAARPKRFEALNRLAFDYFRRRAEDNPSDLSSAAEAIYHGLWLDESLGLLNKLWPDSISFDPRIDPEEFDRHSAARRFVCAKTSAPLSPSEVSRLPREVALDWLDARGTRLLDNRRVESSIQAIREAAGSDYEALEGRPATAAVLARLMYRAGLWDDAVGLAWRFISVVPRDDLAGQQRFEWNDNPRREALLSLLRTWATIVGKSDSHKADASWLAKVAQPVAASVSDPFAAADIAAHAVLAVRDAEQAGLGKLRQYIVQSLSGVRRDRLKREPRILRLGILAGEWSPELLMLWVESRERVPRDSEQSVLVELFLRIFRDTPSESEAGRIVNALDLPQKVEAFNQLDELWRREKPTIMAALLERQRLTPMFRELVAFEHSDWIRPLGNALTRAFKREEGGAELAAMLDESSFQTGRGALKQRRDGLAVVQTAEGEGRLLKLAHSLVSWEKTYYGVGRGGVAQPSVYPQDVFGLSRMLLLWHQKIIKSVHSTRLPPSIR